MYEHKQSQYVCYFIIFNRNIKMNHQQSRKSLLKSKALEYTQHFYLFFQRFPNINRQKNIIDKLFLQQMKNIYFLHIGLFGKESNEFTSDCYYQFITVSLIFMTKIPCHHDNHHYMPIQYVCLHTKCIKVQNSIGCINCLQQSHNKHIDQTQSIKLFLHQLTEQAASNKTQYHILDLLLKGIPKCVNFTELKQNFAELIAYKYNCERFQKIVDKQISTRRNKVAQFYQRNIDKNQSKIGQIVQASKKMDQINFITPILNFQEGGCQLISPFCARNKKQGFYTCIAYPSLNKYVQSIKIDIKVSRITPHWMGIGISLGQQDYKDESKNHLLVLANGWIVQQEKKSKQGIKFTTNDVVCLKWDKQKQVIQFSTHNEQNKCWMKLQNKWDRQAYLCVVFYYKGDSAQILV